MTKLDAGGQAVPVDMLLMVCVLVLSLPVPFRHGRGRHGAARHDLRTPQHTTIPTSVAHTHTDAHTHPMKRTVHRAQGRGASRGESGRTRRPPPGPTAPPAARRAGAGVCVCVCVCVRACMIKGRHVA